MCEGLNNLHARVNLLARRARCAYLILAHLTEMDSDMVSRHVRAINWIKVDIGFVKKGHHF